MIPLSARRQQARVAARNTERSIDEALAAEKVKSDARYAEARAVREAEKARPKLTRDDVLGAAHVFAFGRWLAVVRVNQKTVTVSGLWPWDEPVKFADVLRVSRDGDQ